eukprot:scaffold33247_cov17-Tisochrysis_lutea.AAC.1
MPCQTLGSYRPIFDQFELWTALRNRRFSFRVHISFIAELDEYNFCFWTELATLFLLCGLKAGPSDSLPRTLLQTPHSQKAPAPPC